jgi:TonB family protein
MLTTLIASRPARSSSANGTAASFALHVGIIATMLVATTRQDVFTAPDNSSRVVPLVAPSLPKPAAARPRTAPPRAAQTPTAAPEVPSVDVPPVAVPVEVPTGISTDLAPAPALPVGDGGLGAVTDAGEGTALGSGDAVLGAESVDIPARLRDGAPLPRYPDFLRQSRIEGGVRVRFVVNEDGRADLASLVILESTHPAFAESVRQVLPRLRFTPARVGRERVRQVVEIPFGFQLR